MFATLIKDNAVSISKSHCNMETSLDLKTLTKAWKKTTKMQEMGGMETENSIDIS